MIFRFDRYLGLYVDCQDSVDMDYIYMVYVPHFRFLSHLHWFLVQYSRHAAGKIDLYRWMVEKRRFHDSHERCHVDCHYDSCYGYELYVLSNRNSIHGHQVQSS